MKALYPHASQCNIIRLITMYACQQSRMQACVWGETETYEDVRSKLVVNKTSATLCILPLQYRTQRDCCSKGTKPALPSSLSAFNTTTVHSHNLRTRLRTLSIVIKSSSKVSGQIMAVNPKQYGCRPEVCISTGSERSVKSQRIFKCVSALKTSTLKLNTRLEDKLSLSSTQNTNRKKCSFFFYK